MGASRTPRSEQPDSSTVARLAGRVPQAIRDGDPAGRAVAHRQLGLTLTYHPHERRVSAGFEPAQPYAGTGYGTAIPGAPWLLPVEFALDERGDGAKPGALPIARCHAVARGQGTDSTIYAVATSSLVPGTAGDAAPGYSDMAVSPNPGITPSLSTLSAWFPPTSPRPCPPRPSVTAGRAMRAAAEILVVQGSHRLLPPRVTRAKSARALERRMQLS
jgi:hypothetical protein